VGADPVPAPISTPAPMIEYGPISTLSWMRASGHDGRRMNHCLPPSGATMISAEATILAVDAGLGAERQMVRIRRTRRAFRTSWSPGTTGARKRALSMPTR
jgi:hypothetical protein